MVVSFDLNSSLSPADPLVNPVSSTFKIIGLLFAKPIVTTMTQTTTISCLEDCNSLLGAFHTSVLASNRLFLLKCKSDYVTPPLKTLQSSLSTSRVKAEVLYNSHEALHNLAASYLLLRAELQLFSLPQLCWLPCCPLKHQTQFTKEQALPAPPSTWAAPALVSVWQAPHCLPSRFRHHLPGHST